MRVGISTKVPTWILHLSSSFLAPSIRVWLWSSFPIVDDVHFLDKSSILFEGVLYGIATIIGLIEQGQPANLEVRLRHNHRAESIAIPKLTV